MRIGKQLRNLVMREAETVMLSRTSCIYLGEKYTFSPVTKDELVAHVDGLAKALDDRTWSKRLIDRLFGN